uniref:Uncharacterized protein n=1 Tax=Acrobeloides nanus TaxID=290746 RepID=A0A914EBF7_9BILA
DECDAESLLSTPQRFFYDKVPKKERFIEFCESLGADAQDEENI